MPDYNIPMESATGAQINTGAIRQPDTSIPQSVKPFTPIDPIAQTNKVIGMAEAAGEYQEAQAQRDDAAKDRSVLTALQESGANFHSVEGIDEILKKGEKQLSQKSIDGLLKRKQMIAENGTRLQTELLKKSEAELSLMQTQMEEVYKVMNTPVERYKAALADGKGKLQATEEFNAAAQAAITMLRNEKDSAGKPRYPVDKLDLMAKMSPEDWADKIKESEWKMSHVEKAAKAKKAEAEAEKAEALAESARAGGPKMVALANIDEQVADGTLTKEEGEKRKQSILSSGKAGGPLNPTMSPETLDRIAENFIATGDKSAIPSNLGRGVQGSANLTALEEAITRKMKEKGLSGDEMQKRRMAFQGATAGMKALGQRASRIDAAAYELDLFADNAMGASEKVMRGNVLPINEIMRKVEMGTGSAEEVEFATYVQSLVGAYATVIGRGTPTVHSQEEAAKVIRKDLSQEQFAAMVAALKKEAAAVVKSSSMAGENIKGEAFPRESAQQRKAAMEESTRIKQDELKKERELLAASKTDEDKQLHQRNIADLERELKVKGPKTDASTGLPAGWKVEVKN